MASGFLEYEADQRHAEIIIREMNLKRGNSVSTPAVQQTGEEANLRLASPDMTKEESSRYRGLAARVNYLSLDRPDLQFAAKTASRYMAQPKVCDWDKIKRIARYLIDAPRAVQMFAWQSKPAHVTTCKRLPGTRVKGRSVTMSNSSLECTANKEYASRGANLLEDTTHTRVPPRLA